MWAFPATDAPNLYPYLAYSLGMLLLSRRPRPSRAGATADFPALSAFHPGVARAYHRRAAEGLEVLVYKGRPSLLRRPGVGRAQARPLG